MKRMLKRLAIGVFVLLLFGFLITHFVAPYIILKPQRVHLNQTPADYNVAFDELTIRTEDNLQLSAYLIYPEPIQPKGVFIMVHGIGGCKEHFIPLAAKLSKAGIATLVFDLRAHGESEGTYATYGYHEKNDVRKVVDFIKTKYSTIPIGIWGNSLGGAISLQAMAADPRIDFGIIESTFANMDDIVFDYKKRYLKGIGLRFVSDYTLNRAGKIASFNPDMVRPINAVKKIEKPMFLAHGDADKRICIAYGEALFTNLKSENKIWYPVPGAGHLNLSEIGGAAYQNALFQFIDSNLKK